VTPPTVDRLDAVALGLRAHLNALLPAQVIAKEDSSVHRAIAEALAVAHGGAALLAHLSLDVPVNLPSADDYLTRFGTTIGRSIALPRAWHKPENALKRLYVEPHEWQHVKQFLDGVDAGGWPRIASHTVLYAASVATDEGAEYLGKVEGDAYAVSASTWHFATGQLPSLADNLASLRRNYALRPAGAAVAEGVLRSHYKTIEHGGVPNVWAARESIAWLAANAADVRGAVAP
jgi:hypothetical protein